jgi:hypothetical protein
VQKKFSAYYQGILNHLKEIKIAQNIFADFTRLDGYESEVGFLLKRFPFEEELLFYSGKCNEELKESSFYLEVKNAIIKIFSFDSATGTFKWGDSSLMEIQFALTHLQTPDLSELKRQLLLEYLKSSVDILSYYISRDINGSKDSIISDCRLKVQKYLGDNSFDISCSSSQTANDWMKVLQLLKGLPGTQTFFKNIFSWLLTQLIEQKALTSLLYDCIVHQTQIEKFQSYLLLLRYYLPEFGSQIDEVLQWANNPSVSKDYFTDTYQEVIVSCERQFFLSSSKCDFTPKETTNRFAIYCLALRGLLAFKGKWTTAVK